MVDGPCVEASALRLLYWYIGMYSTRARNMYFSRWIELKEAAARAKAEGVKGVPR